jgi:hypothetical protein
MNKLEIIIRDISYLNAADVQEIRQRLSWRPEYALPDSMRPEIDKRHGECVEGPHAPFTMAAVYHNSYFVAWVATRRWFENFKGEKIQVQTIECFTDPELRQRGFAQLGLQALICAGHIDRKKPVAVYNKTVINIAKRSGCKCVICVAPREDD